GTFVSTLPVRPRLIFTRCSNPTGPGLPTVIADPGPTVNLSTPTTGAVWSYGPMGLAIPPSPGGMVDHDSNSATPPVPYPGTSNFYPGVTQIPPSDCTMPGGTPHKELNAEQEMLAKHGVLPACRPPGTPFALGDGTGAACPCANFGQPGHGCENSFA